VSGTLEVSDTFSFKHNHPFNSLFSFGYYLAVLHEFTHFPGKREECSFAQRIYKGSTTGRASADSDESVVIIG
jgi:hypothetical protein